MRRILEASTQKISPRVYWEFDRKNRLFEWILERMDEMKGYAVIGKGKHGWVEHDPPNIGSLDAIVRPLAVAPCSSDVHYMHTFDDPKRSVIMGHEAVGEVVKVGALVKRFKPGDKVVVSPSTPDWTHPGTQMRGNSAHGERLMGGFKFVGEKDGVFAEQFNVNNADGNMAHLPDDIAIEDALMMLDMMNTGFYGAEIADIQYGDSVVVFGIGPVGLMAVAGAKLKGAGNIYAVGTRPNCAKLALEYGAGAIVSYKKGDVAEQILDLERGKVDKVILASGDASCLNQALQMIKPAGTVANIGYMDRSDVFQFPASLWGLGMADINIVGGFCPGGSLRLEKLMNMIRAGRVSPGKLMNYRFEGFDQIPNAVTAMDEKPADMIKPGVFINW